MRYEYSIFERSAFCSTAPRAGWKARSRDSMEVAHNLQAPSEAVQRGPRTFTTCLGDHRHGPLPTLPRGRPLAPPAPELKRRGGFTDRKKVQGAPASNRRSCPWGATPKR